MDHAHGAAGGELGNGIGNRGRIGTASCTLMNVVNIERSKSGDADPSCSCRNRSGRYGTVRSSRGSPVGLWKVSKKITR
jgi:hypothetical protein